MLGTSQEKKDFEGNSELLRERQAAALAASIDGLAIYGSDERFIFLNQAHARIYGYDSPEELVGKSWEVLYEGAELERFQKWIMPSFREVGFWRGEAMGIKKNGSLFAQEISLSQVREGGLVCVVRDTSARKKEEKKLLLLEDIGRSLSETMDYTSTIDSISSLLIPQFADYCILCLNPIHRFGAQRLVGTMTPLNDEIVKALKKHEFHQDISSPCLKALDLSEQPQVLRELGIHSYLFLPLKVRGVVIGNIVLLRTEKHPEGKFLATDVDSAMLIANRVALAMDNSRLYLEAREAVSVRESLMATVSHDLKNPLTAVSINAEILDRYAKDSAIGHQIARVASNLRVSVERMSGLIHQLLEVEKLRTGRLILEKKRVIVSDLLRRVTVEFQPIADKKEILLEVGDATDLPELFCDPERVMQILSNLLGNAMKFTPSHGKVVLSAASRKDAVVFAVQDSGVGIARAELEYVFELYWQSQRTSSQGSGLGLAIAKGIVQAHGGQIWAESTPGLGSTFNFSIPI
jgi:PAS domain S-box-containing protein